VRYEVGEIRYEMNSPGLKPRAEIIKII